MLSVNMTTIFPILIILFTVFGLLFAIAPLFNYKNNVPKTNRVKIYDDKKQIESFRKFLTPQAVEKINKLE